MTSATPPRPVAVAAAALGLGVTAGMSSQIPLALLAAKSNRAAGSLPPPLYLLRPKGVAIGLAMSAVGEAVGDKLPIAPSRLRPGPLIGRLSFGAAAGAVLALGAGNAAGLGGTMAALGALAGSMAGYTARVQAHKATGLPDPLLAVLEDVVAVTIGLLSLSRWPADQVKR